MIFNHPTATTPLVSIVIPAFNAANWVKEAIVSIWTQTMDSWELIVVDDGSQDETLPVLRALKRERPFRLIQQQHSGPSAARNTGARTARGEWLLFLDADDRLHPRFLAETLAAGSARPAVGVVSTDVRSFGWKEEFLRGPAPTCLSLLDKNTMVVTSLIRRSAFQSVEGFDELMSFGYEDWDLWLRMAQHGWKFLRVPQFLFEYRLRRRGHNQGSHDKLLSHCERLRYLHNKHQALFEEEFPRRPHGCSLSSYLALKAKLRLRHRLSMSFSPDTVWTLGELAKELLSASILPSNTNSSLRR